MRAEELWTARWRLCLSQGESGVELNTLIWATDVTIRDKTKGFIAQDFTETVLSWFEEYKSLFLPPPLPSIHPSLPRSLLLFLHFKHFLYFFIFLTMQASSYEGATFVLRRFVSWCGLNSNLVFSYVHTRTFFQDVMPWGQAMGNLMDTYVYSILNIGFQHFI